METCLVTDMPSSSERYGRGRLSPNPLSMGMHSSLARDELLLPTREEISLLSGGHFDPPLLGGMRGGLSMGDREPSLLDQVMAERQRGGWRLDEDPLLMSRRHDEISRRSDEISRRHDEMFRRDEISRRQDEISRQQSEMSRQQEEATESGGKRIFLRNVREPKMLIN